MCWAFPKLIPIALICVAAQGQTPKPTFEVASVKAATPLGPRGMQADRKGGPGTADPGMYRCTNCPLFWVVSEAYDLQPFEYVGPDWLHEERFDFAATVPAGTTKEGLHAMLQNLLADRFKMAVHREKKEMTVYELSLAKNAPQFQESAPEDAPKADGPAGRLERDRDGFPILSGGMTMAIVHGHARIRSDHQTMEWFARMLSGQLQGPVVDATGLKGKYDFVLSWSFEDNNAAGGSQLDTYRPALLSAVRSDLGLKLDQKKGRVEVVVVDHIEKVPTGN